MREELYASLGAITTKLAICEYYARMADQLQPPTPELQATNFDHHLPELYAAVLTFVMKVTKYFKHRTGMFPLYGTYRLARVTVVTVHANTQQRELNLA